MISKELINQKTFYRYYPAHSSAMTVSYEGMNKYGFGIYFLDNSLYYADRYHHANLMAIRPNLKNPKIYPQSPTRIPNSAYLKELIKFISSGSHRYGRNDFSQHLLDSGYDSIVIPEPRGIYLIFLKNDPMLYTVIFDGRT